MLRSAQRNPATPDVPTAAETLPGFEADTWDGGFAPALLPSLVVERVDAAVRVSLAHTGFVSRLETARLQPFPAGLVEFVTFQRVEVEKWGQAVRAANITAD